MSKFHYKDAPSPKEKNAFKGYLSEDEDLVLVTGLSSAYLRQEFIIYWLFPGVIGAALGIVIGWILAWDRVWISVLAITLLLVVAFLKAYHLHHANRYILTTRRIMIKKGLFSVKLYAALYDKITHLEVDQTFLDRLLLHHGDVIINTAGQNRNEMILKYVDYPIELKNLLERLINRERESYGRGAGAVSAVEGEIVDED